MWLRLSHVKSYYFHRVLSLIIVLVLAFGVTSILIQISGFNTGKVYAVLFSGGFGSWHRLGQTLTQATPLLLCAIGLIFAFKAGVWNIGAEGQLYIGAVGAFVTGYFVPSIPAPLHILVVIIAAFIFGGIWGVIPGFLKAKYKVNEIITSLLMVYIATWLVTYLIGFPWRSAITVGFPVSEEVWSTAQLPFLPGLATHAGFLIALVLTVIVWFILERSVYGYRIKAVGANPDAALYGGIPVTRIITTSMFLSGGLAGLAGMAQVSGVFHVLADNISTGYGFLAILVAFVGRLHPFGILVMAIFVGGLLAGSHYVQISLGLDVTVVHVLVAIIMLSFVMQPFIEKRLERLFTRI